MNIRIATRPRLTKELTRRKLRYAAVSEAVEKGFGAVSIAGVVNRARVSAGTVYVHFDSKEDMLQQVFLEVKSEFHAMMMQAREEPDSAAMIKRMWMDTFNFVTEHPYDFLFLEYGNSAKILTPEQSKEVHRMSREINNLLQQGIDDGTLAPIDVQMVSLLLIAPALQLARHQALSGKPLDPNMVELTFNRVWRSIAV